jgi:hypothetical protein
MVIGLLVCREAGDSSRAQVSRPRPALTRRPAKGSVLARIGMLSTTGDPAHGRLLAMLVRPQSALRYAAPRFHGMSIADEKARAFLTSPLSTPGPDEASARSGSVQSDERASDFPLTD